MRVGIDPDEDAPLERTGAALANQTLHDRIIGTTRPKFMGNPMGMMGNLQPTDGDCNTPEQVLYGADDGVVFQDIPDRCLKT